MDVDVNMLAVLLAALSSMVVGSIWYSRGVFGTTWGKLAKLDMTRPVKASQMIWLLSSTFVASLLTAYVLAHVTFLANRFFGNSYMSDALQTAFWLWLGLTATRVYVHDAFESRPWKLTVLTAGHELVTLLIMALIIGLMGV